MVIVNRLEGVCPRDNNNKSYLLSINPGLLLNLYFYASTSVFLEYEIQREAL
jgi:hypothetical protein